MTVERPYFGVPKRENLSKENVFAQSINRLRQEIDSLVSEGYPDVELRLETERVIGALEASDDDRVVGIMEQPLHSAISDLYVAIYRNNVQPDQKGEINSKLDAIRALLQHK